MFNDHLLHAGLEHLGESGPQDSCDAVPTVPFSGAEHHRLNATGFNAAQLNCTFKDVTLVSTSLLIRRYDSTSTIVGKSQRTCERSQS